MNTTPISGPISGSISGPDPVATVFAGRLLARPGAAPELRDRLIAVADGRIAEVAEADATPSGAHREILGGPGSLVLPALFNAHDHGRGLKPLAYGAEDAPLEMWLPATYTHPDVDPYLVAGVAFSRMARGGFAGAVHCHLSRPPDVLLSHAEAVARAARDVGVRIAFVVPMRDRNRMVYGADARMLETLGADRDAVAETWLKPLAPLDDQLAVVEAIAERCESDLFHVQYGPLGVEFCSDAMLEAVAEASARTDRRVHMHLLESPYQREWVDAAYTQGVVKRLDEMGLLTDRLTCAHGVWLTPEECELLAQRRVIVSVNTSSNLRLRSGVAPVAEMVKAGLPLAHGIDAASVDDDDDGIRELRLTYQLHAGTGMEEVLSPAALFHAATAESPRAVTGADGFGEIAPGRPADMLVMDWNAMTADFIDGLQDATDVFLARASGRYLQALVVAGRLVVDNGRVAGFDFAAAEKELTAQANAHGAGLRALRPLLKRYQAALRRFYLEKRHLEP